MDAHEFCNFGYGTRSVRCRGRILRRSPRLNGTGAMGGYGTGNTGGVFSNTSRRGPLAPPASRRELVLNKIFNVTDPLEARRARHAQLIGGSKVVLNGKVVRGKVVRVFQASREQPWEVEMRLPDQREFQT